MNSSMKTMIITYDLYKPGANYELLLKKIKSFGYWAKLGGSSYLINTIKTPTEVRNELQKALDTNDKLFVSMCPRPSAWYGQPEDVSKWILSNQK